MKRLVCALLVLACGSAIAQTSEIAAAQTQKQNKNKNAKMAPFNRGDDPLPMDMKGSYNAPAGIAMKSDDGSWMPDAFFDISFLYYYASQDGMDLTTSAQIINPSSSSALNTATANAVVVSQDFTYKPAFKVGLGTNFCEWMLAAEYTWIRQTTTSSGTPTGPQPVISGIASFVPSNWFEQLNPEGYALSGTAFSSSWKLGMDIIDLSLGRPFYQGRSATISPFFGLRSAFIRQKLNMNLTVSTLVQNVTVASPLSSTSSNSWSIGPRAGMSGSVLVGAGFRFEGNMALSALYTSYTSVKHREQLALPVNGESVIGVKQNSRTNVVRPELEMGLGLGWGMYLDDQSYHIDLYAGYDFNVFWDQNMMRSLMDVAVEGVASGPGSLYLQGLDIQFRFDF